MTPAQKIKHLTILRLCEWDDAEPPVVTEDNIDELFEESEYWDALSELREGQVSTPEIDAPYSRHYESRAVAAKYVDGSWVGWTYWYGGGKHGNPGEIDWMDEAYDLSCVEEEKVVVVKTFAKV